VGDNVKIGENTTLHANVSVYMGCEIGNDCLIHAGVVVGSDGFGHAPQNDGTYTKIPQIGNVVIENHVEIGANTTIDRGTMGSTRICDGVKLDNLIQVAHNVVIGKNTVIAAQTGISGSTKIGENCMIGGQVGFVGHISITNGVKIGAQSGVSKDIRIEKSAWRGSPVQEYRQQLKSEAVFRQLEELSKKVHELEKMMKG
jgi:UDP-3-O-[3-hydroxymyristoyl] glucosamine N-acyltransferase